MDVEKPVVKYVMNTEQTMILVEAVMENETNQMITENGKILSHNLKSRFEFRKMMRDSEKYEARNDEIKRRKRNSDSE